VAEGDQRGVDAVLQRRAVTDQEAQRGGDAADAGIGGAGVDDWSPITAVRLFVCAAAARLAARARVRRASTSSAETI
jgi:hypothetical protein